VICMMNEYSDSYAEYVQPSDLHDPKEHPDNDTLEYFKGLDDYPDCGHEYSEHIVLEETASADKRIAEEARKKKKRHAKLVKKMAYTVASAASVIVLTQAAEPDKVVQGSFLDQIRPTSIAGLTIVFSGTGELTAEEVQEELEKYELDGGFRVVIEDGITALGKYAFSNYDDLLEVEIPSSVTAFGHGVFNGCDELEIERFTTAGRTLGNNVFSRVRIGEVELSDSFVLDGQYVFQNAEIGRVSFETGIRKIPRNAFNNCDSITEVTIPGSVEEIGAYAFSDCDKLTRVEIPSGVTTLGRGVFNGCDKLTLSVSSGSAAETYAIEQGIPYRIN